MLKEANFMIRLFVLLPLLILAETTAPRAGGISDVRLNGTSGNYGILEVKVGGQWSVVCETGFSLTAAKVFCKQLNYKDGTFLTGMAMGSLPSSQLMTTFDFDCTGLEASIQGCVIRDEGYCSSRNYVTLYCSLSNIENKDKMEVRIKDNLNYGRLEVNMYGFWTSICKVGWTDIEADAACQYLNFAGGKAYYAETEPNDSTPVVVGGFNCSDENLAFAGCTHKGFEEDIGCQFSKDNRGPKAVAGVLCYKNEDSDIKFRLSDHWYGRVEMKYDNEWGRVCNNGWDDTDASVVCKQLGYVDGRLERNGISRPQGTGFVRMDDVNCEGHESNILECKHSASWKPALSSCQDATAVCNITICGSLDIRNTVDELSRLENCSVIEGNLTILLIGASSHEEYEKYSFPNLVEITEFFVLFRAKGLKSLRHLFPNLAVIRGDRLFSDYALVSFEMQDLVELGLPNLVSIPRGAVRLDKNPKLCYIETIDWSRITNVPEGENYFGHNNNERDECVNRCHQSCPTFMVNGAEKQYCWSIQEDSCQKMLKCPDGCASGICSGDICCDKNCMGGCTGPSASQCTACQHVSVRGANGFPRCAQRCTAGTYLYRKHRCLYADECLNFDEYKIKLCGQKTSNVPAINGKIRNCLKLVEPTNIQSPGQCVLDCPQEYNVDFNDEQKCLKCKGRCPKTCGGQEIDSVTSANSLANCNIINGPLILNLLRGNLVGPILERTMGQIQEVKDFIKITHAPTLLSLHFFKSLERIGGENLYKNRFALYIHDNANLQELVPDNVQSNLTIGAGEIHMQYNGKLCYNKIVKFTQAIGYTTNLDNEEISPTTNGDRTACEIQELMFEVFLTSPHIAFVKFDKANITDSRQLIGYSINWKAAPYRNVSIYTDRDACSNDIWETVETCNTDDTNHCDEGMAYITGLEPWTQYAAYMQAVTLSKAVQGAISKIIYFNTTSEVPTSPTNLKVLSENPGELKVTWDPPKKPKGNVTHFLVYWQLQDLDAKVYELRDYCAHPLISNAAQREEKRKEEEAKNRTLSEDCCACPKTEKQKHFEERERDLDIRFQDFLQNAVYVKRLEPAITTMGVKRVIKRSGRSVDRPSPTPHEVNKYTYANDPGDGGTVGVDLPSDNPSSLTVTESPTPTPPTEITEEPQENVHYFADVYMERVFIITGLGHFEDYSIKVIACQERETKKSKMKCSQQALGFGRTLPDEKADTINSSKINVQVVTNVTGAVYIKWEDPADPNGLIIAYDIEYQKSNLQNVKPNVLCITYKKYRDEGNRGHLLDKLEPGNYTFRLRATSLAGNGSWTSYIEFEIEDKEVTEMSQTILIIVIVSCIGVIIFVVVTAVWFIAKKRFKLPDTIVSTNPIYDEHGDLIAVYEPDEWEVDRENVKLLRELGQGSFGMVYEGIVKNLMPEPIRVAVKTTNAQSNDRDRVQFLQEASTMKAFNCHHVVKLIGVVSKDQPAYVLMELMPKGDLKNFLRQHRPDEEDNNGLQPPTLKQILQIAGEVADGMAYLADKKYVHRDLAARNCMVGENLIVKIGDFGMTRDIYETDYYRKGSRGLLPVRWMAPESLRDGVFTSMTDVWSYGVVLWEMATLAAQPYQGLSNEEVLRYVGSGKIMDAPEQCPTKLYDLMVKCWRFRPKNRPTFKEIIEQLLADLDPSFQDVSYFFSDESAKYEEGKNAVFANHQDMNDKDGSDVEDDQTCPMNDYVDAELQEQLPMLCAGASNGHSVELQDLFTDNGTYPHYNSSNNRQDVGSAEACICQDYRDGHEGAAAQSVLHNRRSMCSSPNSAIGGSSDGSKDSSKSSSSSYAHMNGISVANGHVPLDLRTTHC